MRISTKMNAAINAQIGMELASSNQYLNTAAYFAGRALRKLAEFFFKQSDEEREHALRLIRYLNDMDGTVEIPAIGAARSSFDSAEEAIQLAYDSEVKITASINALMEQAIEERDFATQEMLRWFVNEQVEEVSTMDDMLKIARQVGERNIIMVEAYLVHEEV
ncbi:MAG: ferritin [Chloroherpetonaceae bacterium]|nr:ferritin [Chthonomonadaceae bacterium]MDW8207774.1 ferritin [Chloroherpetonaceae bacterium]